MCHATNHKAYLRLEHGQTAASLSLQVKQLSALCRPKESLPLRVKDSRALPRGGKGPWKVAGDLMAGSFGGAPQPPTRVICHIDLDCFYAQVRAGLQADVDPWPVGGPTVR